MVLLLQAMLSQLLIIFQPWLVIVLNTFEENYKYNLKIIIL